MASEIKELRQAVHYEQPCQHCKRWGFWIAYNRGGPICTDCLSSLYVQPATEEAGKPSEGKAA